MKIQVVYLDEHQQSVFTLDVNAPCSVRQAIEQSGILRQCPEINLSSNKVGIWGQLVKAETLLQAGDRVEIYRPLKVDPKEARRLRAERAKA